MEANQKRPSGLGKIKDKSREEDVEFIAGDIYDLSDSNRYTEKMKYYKGEGNGYITDKEGHVYDVFTRAEQGDAGRIAGGSTYRYVTIKNVKGVDIKFRGYSAIFSSSRGMDIIDDIEAGMYLEDYLAKHWGDISNDVQKNKEIEKLKETGNAEAKTYNKQKEESAADKELKFWERYLIVRNIKISVKNGDIEIDTQDADEHYKRKLGREKYKKENGWNEEELYKEYISVLKDALKPAVSKIFSDTFGCSLDDMNGLVFNIVAKANRNIPMIRLGFDTKKKEFVELAYEKAKLRGKNEWVGTTIEPAIGPTVTLVKKDANEHMIEIFINASNEWMKLNKGKQHEWVNKNWEAIWKSGNSYHWLYGQQTMSKTDAKKTAAEDYKKDLAAHKWDTSGDTITFLTEFISQFMTAPEKIEQVTGEEVEESPKDVSKKERGKNTVMGKGARAKQEPKMDAWHKGERKQNVANCSDAKLKLNYQICKDKGYEKEAAQLKAEADRRGIVLESLSLTEFIEIYNDIND